MKSNKQKRAEMTKERTEREHIRALRAEGGQNLWNQLNETDDPSVRRLLLARAAKAGISVIEADLRILYSLNNTYGPIPRYYVDKMFTCTQCGAQELWTAKQQQWWYEVAHGFIYSNAVECRACRRARREAKSHDLLYVVTNRLHHLAGRSPDAPARAEVETALQSKWQGLRVTAIGVIGAWWGRERNPQDLERLRHWLHHDDGVYGGWNQVAAQAAGKALAPHLRDEDMAWALDWLMSIADDWVQMRLARWVPPDVLLRALASPHALHMAQTDSASAEKLYDLLRALDASHIDWLMLARRYLELPAKSPRVIKSLQRTLERGKDAGQQS
jgi:hypothetical protein